MNKFNYLVLSLLFVGIFTACSSDDDNNITGSELTAKFETTISRALGTQWSTSDAIGIYAIEAGKSLADENIYEGKANIRYTTPGNGIFTAGKPSEAIKFPKDGSALDFISYYPQGEVKGYTYAVDVADQSNLEQIDLLYSNNAKGATKNEGTVALEFIHQLAQLTFNVTKGDGVESLEGLTVGIKGLVTEGDFSLVNGELNLKKEAKEMKPVTKLAKDKASATIESIVLPLQDLKEATVLFTLGGVNYEWRPNAEELAVGKNYTYKFQISKSGLAVLTPNATIQDWIEAETSGETIVLKPEEGEVELSLDQSNIALESAASEVKVQVLAQKEYAWNTKSDASWVKVTPASGTGNGELTLTADENKTKEERKATITVFGKTTEVTLVLTQKGAVEVPSQKNLLFPGSDFEDWAAFESSLSFKPHAGVAQADEGYNSDKSLSFTGTNTKNAYMFSVGNKSLLPATVKTISFYVKGKSDKTLSINVYSGANDFKAFNVGAISDSDMTVEPSDQNDYNGIIDTKDKWTKVSLNVEGINMHGAGESFFSVKFGKGTTFDIRIDEITFE